MGLYDGFGEGVSLGGMTEEEISKSAKAKVGAAFGRVHGAALRSKNGFKQGFKAAKNPQANVSGSPYLAGAVARKTAPVAIIGGAGGAGYLGHDKIKAEAENFKEKRATKKLQNDIWKSEVSKLGPATNRHQSVFSIPKSGGAPAAADRVNVFQRENSPILNRPRYDTRAYNAAAISAKQRDKYTHLTHVPTTSLVGSKRLQTMKSAIKDGKAGEGKVTYEDIRRKKTQRGQKHSLKKSDSTSAFGINH